MSRLKRAVANRLRRRTSDQTVLGSNPAVAAALSPWTRLFTPIVPRRSLHISFNKLSGHPCKIYAGKKKKKKKKKLLQCKYMWSSCRITWNMPHGAACTCCPVTARNSHDHRYHQKSLSRARDGTGRKKRKGRKDQREWLCMFHNGKPVSDFILHAWCVGRNFCGYLILRFFPNRKNSQNIVPANNSNNKVLRGWN